MKAKLTLTIEEDLIPAAKRYAKTKGVSLSQVVEASLKRVALVAAPAPFSRKWRGAFSAVRTESSRFQLLAKRYL